MCCLLLKVHSTNTQQCSTPPPKSEAAEASRPQQQSDTNQRLERRRKQSQGDWDRGSQTRHNLIERQPGTTPPACPNENEAAHGDPNQDEHDWVRQWAEKVTYPEPSSDSDSNMIRLPDKKRSSSSMSYSQSVKEGLNPPQYTPGYEEVLKHAGIYMNEELGQTISNTSQELCGTLLNSFFPPPSNSLFGGRLFLLTLDELRNENEPRVQRDVTPLLIPCASLLYLSDRILQCQHLSTKIQSEWTKVTPLAGPLPVPDYVVGLKRSAFTHDEVVQLQTYSAPNKATVFRDGLYFPFLVCEVSIDRFRACQTNLRSFKVKCGENGLSIAERQSMHVASVAANAIIELLRDPAVSRVRELHREILVFSISHDHVNVRIHGHYACVEGDAITLHRHLIRSFDIRDQNGKEKWTTYHIVRKIYDYFVPIHLERIHGAIEKLPVGLRFVPSFASLESNQRGDKETESDSQEMTEGASSSKDTDRAKKPRLKPTVLLHQEVELLKELLRNQKDESNQRYAGLMEDSERQKKKDSEAMERLYQQMEDSERQKKKDSEAMERLYQQNQQLIDTIQSLIAQPKV